MSLAERFAAAPPVTRGLPCPISVILEQLPAVDADVLRDQFTKQLGSPDRLANTTIAALLSDEGYPIHYKGVERHRKRECRCYRGTGL